MTLDPYPVLADPANAALIRVRPILEQLSWPVDEARLAQSFQGYPGQEVTGGVTGQVGDMGLAVLTGEATFPVPNGFTAPLFIWGVAFLLAEEAFAVEVWPVPFEVPKQGSVLTVPVNLWALEGQPVDSPN